MTYTLKTFLWFSLKNAEGLMKNTLIALVKIIFRTDKSMRVLKKGMSF